MVSSNACSTVDLGVLGIGCSPVTVAIREDIARVDPAAWSVGHPHQHSGVAENLHHRFLRMLSLPLGDLRLSGGVRDRMSYDRRLILALACVVHRAIARKQ